MLTLTREQVREVDRLAIEQLGIPGIVLMENAGRHVTHAVLDLLEDELHLLPNDARVAILCGGGNNGGDGYVVARHLYNAGVAVTVYTVKDPATLTGDAATNYQIIFNIGQSLPLLDTHEFIQNANASAPHHVIVDALLGTGFHGEVREELAAVIEACNAAGVSGTRIVAVDIPSGLDCNTGQPSQATVRADLTVTLVAMKTGLVNESAQPHVGQVLVVDIGAPPELLMHV